MLLLLGLLDLFQKLELHSILSYLKALFKLYVESEWDVENRRHQAEVRLIKYVVIVVLFP